MGMDDIAVPESHERIDVLIMLRLCRAELKSPVIRTASPHPYQSTSVLFIMLPPYSINFSPHILPLLPHPSPPPI
jgi:hypothetical protein